MNTKTIYKTAAACLATSMMLTSCIDEMQPTGVLSSDQASSLPASQKALLNGIVNYMVSYNSWGVDENSGYYTNDWGYPCQMFFRDVQLADMPVYDASYSYWYSIESGEQTRYTPYYTYNYYYELISCINDLVKVIDPETATETSLDYLGCALTYRALAYLDLARMFEYKKTGIASLDAYADSHSIWGLTIPIVTESTTLDETKHNPRAPFETIYRFILNDLDNAETYLDGFKRGSDYTLPDLSVVYGLKARLWLELASRFEQRPEDLSKMEEAVSANECYKKAQDFARKALAAGSYTPTTSADWHNRLIGFNTPTSAWMWGMSISQKEQLPYQYYNTFTATLANEPSWAMGPGYNAYRCIGSSLYEKIGDGDWRKSTWVDPADAGNSDAVDNYETSLEGDGFAALPPYANLKFRPADGNLDDYYVGLLVDIPLMRMEEMMFIDIECTARLQGIGAGYEALKQFVNAYRYTDGSYNPPMGAYLYEFINEMMVQKRVEFWGEGIVYFDYKRMNLQVRRKDNTNYKYAFMINSVKDCTAPWMNYFILEYEQELNTALVPNPDTSGAIKTSDNY